MSSPEMSQESQKGGKYGHTISVSRSEGLRHLEVSAGELGTDAAALEGRLNQIFELASRWNAVLLLDETDTYMEKRSMQDIQRNGLVYVSLRKLEYCEAILFLTTSRVTSFDDAVLSRMHIMIAFPDIDLDFRKQIWNRFLDRAATVQGPAKVTAKELKRLREQQLRCCCCRHTILLTNVLDQERGYDCSRNGK